MMMPRYFFDLANHNNDVDDTGSELSHAAAARIEAVVFAGQYLSNNPEAVWDGSQFSVRVRNESDELLFIVDVTVRDMKKEQAAPDLHREPLP
jgi:hypothetical protein